MTTTTGERRRVVPEWRLVLAVARLEMTSYTRTVGGLLFALLAPAAILVVAVTFWYPAEVRDVAVPDVVSLSILSTGVFSIGVAITEQRKEGTLKTYLASPLSARTYLTAQVLDRLAVITVGNLVMVLLARLAYGIRPNGAPLVFLGVMVLAIATLLAFGFLLSGRFRTVEGAGAASTGLFMLGMFAAGFFADPGALAPSLVRILDLLPFKPMVDAMRGAWFGDQALLRPVVVLAAWAIVFSALAVRWFKWSPDDR